MNQPGNVSSPSSAHDELWDQLLSELDPAAAHTAQRTFQDWLGEVTPAFVWDFRHLLYLQAALEKVARGETTRLLIQMPPRHGKSEMTTVRFPIWLLEQNPALRFIVGAYNQTLANKFSRKSKRIAQARITLSHDRKAVDDWETPDGGGIRAVGIGGGVTGQGANGIIIDDPVKNREEAESETYRDKVWDWYTDDIYTRLEPGGFIIVIMTRWHEDDLAGRLMRDATQGGDEWEVVNLPALAEENDPLGRAVGEALCPERYNVAALKRIQRVMGISFDALYQQRPTAKEGGLFKRHWLTKLVDAVPVVARRIRYWDRAATAGGGDYTVGVLMAMTPDRQFYVEDVVRGQWSSGERDKIILQTAQLDHPRVAGIWVEQEPGSSGKDAALAITRLLAGYPIRAEPVSGDKAIRADGFAAQCEVGNVSIKRADWNKAYIEELCSFPRGTNDDQVDGSSGAFNKLALGGGGDLIR